MVPGPHSVNVNPKPVHDFKFSQDLFPLIPGESPLLLLHAVGELLLVHLFIKDEAFRAPALCKGSHFQLPMGIGQSLISHTYKYVDINTQEQHSTHTPALLIPKSHTSSHADHSAFQLSSSWQVPFFPANLALYLKNVIF